MTGSEPFALNAEQRQRLLAARAAWEEDEGEERLERLRQREEDAETLQQIARTLSTTDFRRQRQLTRQQLSGLLTLFRALAPNPNLDARLLTRPGEPETFNQDLWDLLYGPVSGPLRLRQFLARRHAGQQTALQLLCGVFPQDWPLVTPKGLRFLDLTPEQRERALRAARERFDLPIDLPTSGEMAAEHAGAAPAPPHLPANDPILLLLAGVTVYSEVRAILELPDYLAVHRLLTEAATVSVRRRRQANSVMKRQPRPTLRATSAPFAGSVLPPSNRVLAPDRPHYAANPYPDIDGILTADLLATLEAEIAAQGFTYPPLILRDYFLCLQSKPYVWLLGANGIGKTRLTSLFAAAMTGGRDDHYQLIPVRPDWSDSAPLLGYVNLLAGQGEGRYVGTPFLNFVLRAGDAQHAPECFFLCLDEMNLARVEHYFAEVLSAMEMPSHTLLLPNGQELALPPNLFITGTLNTDETTHPLSRKVLDRANTLSLRAVSLRPPPSIQGATPRPLPPDVRQAIFLRRRITAAANASARLAGIAATNLAEWVVDRLIEVNALLEPTDLQFAYRVRDEALCYCANSFDIDGTGLLTPDARQNITVALDFQLLQKVLPRLTGTEGQLAAPLAALLRWAEQGGFERTAQKLHVLLSRLQRDGFVGFD